MVLILTVIRMDCPDKHFLTLKKRFNDKKLTEAAVRRAHLAYKPIRIGYGNGSGKVRFLLAQLHQNYYFGYFETACTMAGVLLEQGLVLRLSTFIADRGPVLYKKKGESIWIQNREDLLSLDLIDLMQIVYENKLLKDERLMHQAHQIRWIRNMVVHDRMPQFKTEKNGYLEMQVIKSRKRPMKYAIVKLKREEVENLAGKRGEITAYFCISRVRSILEQLLDDTAAIKETGEENEDSGYLFRWEES